MYSYELTCWLILEIDPNSIYPKNDKFEKKGQFYGTALGNNVPSSDEPESTLSERICNARQAAGLTLNLASHLSGVKASTLRDLERDRSEPRVNKFVALAGIFGVSPIHLLPEEGNSSNPAVVTKGRHDKVIALCKAEIAEIEKQQIKLTEKLSQISKFLKKIH